ncbi:hypothetical protein [Streptomyces sp. NPDC001927]
MSTDAHRPASARVTDALLPPPEPAGRGDETTPTPEAAATRPPVPARPPQPPATPALPPRPATAPRAATPAPEGAPASAAGPLVVPPRPAAAPQAPGSGRVPAPGGSTAPGAAGAPRVGPDRVTGPAGGSPRPAAAPRAGTPAPEGATAPGGGPRVVPPRPAATPQAGPGRTPAPAPDRVIAPRTGSAHSAVPAVETTTRLRPIREAAPGTGQGHGTGLPPRSGPPSGQTYGTYGAYRAFTAPPETPVETTTRLRPIRDRRAVGRVVAAGACLVLGVGLLGGALAGAVLAATDAGAPPEPEGYTEAGTLWHSVPVDTLFPRTLAGPGKGPGAADRTWTRVVVAPDTPCTAAVLPASVLTTLRPVGCDRVLRATYTDATASSVITVGLVFTHADPTATRTLATDSAARLAADVPPALAGPGTVAARFGPGQRASWSTRALADLPVVVTAVSGFADGRPVATPESVARAMADGQTSPTAQAGLGHEAKGVADQIERALRATVATAAKDADT